MLPPEPGFWFGEDQARYVVATKTPEALEHKAKTTNVLRHASVRQAVTPSLSTTSSATKPRLPSTIFMHLARSVLPGLIG